MPFSLILNDFSNVEQKSMNRRFDHDRRVFKFVAAVAASTLRYFL